MVQRPLPRLVCILYCLRPRHLCITAAVALPLSQAAAVCLFEASLPASKLLAGCCRCTMHSVHSASCHPSRDDRHVDTSASLPAGLDTLYQHQYGLANAHNRPNRLSDRRHPDRALQKATAGSRAIFSWQQRSAWLSRIRCAVDQAAGGDSCKAVSAEHVRRDISRPKLCSDVCVHLSDTFSLSSLRVKAFADVVLVLHVV